MTDKTYDKIIIGGLLFSFIILIVLIQLTKASIQWQNSVLSWISWFSIILPILVVCFNIVASFTSFGEKFRAWSSALYTALVIYFGILIISLSFYKELLEQIRWDPTMLALGIAIVAFGWTFVTQHLQQRTIKQNQEKIDTVLSSINENVEDLKKSADTCLEKIEDRNIRRFVSRRQPSKFVTRR